MSARMCLVGVCVAGAVAVGARGQPLETVTISIVWDKAVIQHGETNTGKVIATVSPKIGDTVAWNTAPGTGQAGTLMMLSNAVLDLLNVDNGTKGNLEWTVPAKWNAAQMPGTLTTEGDIEGMYAAQFIPPLNPDPDYSQAPTICLLAWTETDGGGAYDVMFESLLTTAKVQLDVGLASWVAENCVKVDGKGGFSVVPGPGAGTVFLSVGGVLALRRRRGEKETN